MAEQKNTQQVTTEELGHLQTLNQNFNAVKIAIANAAVEQKNQIDKLADIQAEFAELEKELMKNYGENARINLQTGEVSHPEEENVVEALEKVK